MSAANCPPPPALLSLRPENIPAELLAYDRWGTWALEWRDGTNGKPGMWTKVPKNPRCPTANADTSKPGTWGPSTAVLGVYARVGFLMEAGDPYTMIDVDNAIEAATGQIKPWAQELVRRFPGAYWERSPSGTGLKGLVRGQLAKNRIIPIGDGKVEFFDDGKYTTLTGHCIEGSSPTIGDCQVAIDAFFTGLAEPASRPRGERPTLDLDDEAILQRVRQMPKGRQLHDAGDGGDYPSGSEADLGLCNCYVAGGATNEEQIDRLFRSSAWYPERAEKWERSDYRQRTITRAFDGTIIPFRPATITRSASCGFAPPDAETLAATGTENATASNINALPNDVAALKAMIVALTRRVEMAERRANAAEARATQAEARATMLGKVQSTTGRIIRNGHLGQERMTAVALSYAFANREAAGDEGVGGLFAIPLARIAETAGVSEDSASKHVKKLTEAGVLRKELRFIPERVDSSTGEILPAQRRQYIGPATGKVVDFVEAVAALAPEKPKNWGGKRTTCPDHPNAGTIKRWSIHCAECDRLLDQGNDPPRPAPSPNPQVADLLDDPFEPLGGDTDPQSATSSRSVVNHYRYRNLRVDYNDESKIARYDDSGTTVAAAFQRAQPLPGMPPDAPPLDQWTG